MLRSFRHQLARKLGYRRIESRFQNVDAFEAQARLLGGRSVSTIFDIGANIGQTARRYRERFPGATLYCFEPFPGAFEQLQRNVGSDANLRALPMAVADAPGTRTFHVNRENFNHSLLGAAPEGTRWARIEHVGSIEVPCTSVDTFCAEQRIPEVQILKIDAEGGDLLVLRGATTMLSTRRIGLVFVEALFVPMFAGQAYFHDLCRFLAEFGYRPYDLFDHRYAPSGQLRQCNAIFAVPEPG